MSKTLAKLNLISVVQQLPKEDIETIQGYVRMIEKENQELKEKLDKYENPEDMTLMMMWSTEKVKDENKELKKKYENAVADYETTMTEKNKLETQQKEFIKYLEDEKDRLIKETSHYYIDSFDRQHAVNETIYDEVNIILQKYKSIIGEDKKWEQTTTQ